MTKSWLMLIGLSVFACVIVSGTIDKPRFFPPKVSTTNNPTELGLKLGRYLFYDPILSSDSSISCSSCHKQEFAFADRGNRFSTGVNKNKTKRNTPPLFNLEWYKQFFWDGREKTIETQAFHPVRSVNEMNLNWKTAETRLNASTFYKKQFKKAFNITHIDSTYVVKAIGQFERTLVSNNSKYDKVLRKEAFFTKDEYAGFVIANDQSMGDCLHCHPTDSDALGTTGKMSNNGLDSFSTQNDLIDLGLFETTSNPKDLGLFKIPSLRNIALTSPYMHDGRFNTLQEVVDFYSENVNKNPTIDTKMNYAYQCGVKLSQRQKHQLISFLLTLTDSTFITNKDFSNPFILDNHESN